MSEQKSSYSGGATGRISLGTGQIVEAPLFCIEHCPSLGHFQAISKNPRLAEHTRADAGNRMMEIGRCAMERKCSISTTWTSGSEHRCLVTDQPMPNPLDSLLK
ncbi:hypothetical protein A2708_00830 [Candidatus Saccharibacteria bacterium RIFCSPHIGHO2_01_FULL_49_21]|nr:MAG: hypothetical protein A2708_00830 [Candidatus Saccharibacteria bacterium RIFCSPHIGHO2_01_FULL_49_21]